MKDLWEKLNEKVILEYKFDNEANFKTLFTDFLKAQKDNFTSDGINERISKIEIKDPLKTLGVHDVLVRVHPEITTTIKVNVIAE